MSGTLKHLQQLKTQWRKLQSPRDGSEHSCISISIWYTIVSPKRETNTKHIKHTQSHIVSHYPSQRGTTSVKFTTRGGVVGYVKAPWVAS